MLGVKAVSPESDLACMPLPDHFGETLEATDIGDDGKGGFGKGKAQCSSEQSAYVAAQGKFQSHAEAVSVNCRNRGLRETFQPCVNCLNALDLLVKGHLLGSSRLTGDRGYHLIVRLRSKPAQKDFPEPRSRPTLASGSSPAIPTAWSKAFHRATLMALRFSGLLRVMKPTCPSRW